MFPSNLWKWRTWEHDALIQQQTQLKPAEGLLYPGSQHNVGLWLSGSHPAKRDGGGAGDTDRNSIVFVWFFIPGCRVLDALDHKLLVWTWIWIHLAVSMPLRSPDLLSEPHAGWPKAAARQTLPLSAFSCLSQSEPKLPKTPCIFPPQWLR